MCKSLLQNEPAGDVALITTNVGIKRRGCEKGLERHARYAPSQRTMRLHHVLLHVTVQCSLCAPKS